jgi:hypothetical protein
LAKVPKGGRPLRDVSAPWENPPGIPSGGVIFERPKPVTQHSTIFQGCKIDFAARVDEDMTVAGYQMVIQDPEEHHTYILMLDQMTLNSIKQVVNEMPEVGDKVPEEHQETMH